MYTTFFLRRSIIGFSFLVPFIPFIITGALPFLFISGKGFAFRFIVLIIFSLWLLLAALDKNYRPHSSPLLWAALSFVVVMLVAALFGEDPYKSFWSNFERMEGAITLLHLGAYFLVLGSVFTTKEWRAYFYLSLSVSVTLAFYGLLQLGGAFPIHQGRLRPDASFGNATYFAGYLLIHVFLALFLTTRAGTARALRYTLFSSVVLFSTVLIATGTRGAALALALGLLVYAVYGAFRLSGARRVLALLSLVLLLASPFVLISLRERPFIAENGILSRLATVSLTNEDMQARFIIWRMALQGLKERPLLGWGQENFNYIFNAHYDTRLEGREEWFDRTHNIFLDWAVAGGLFGLLGYLSLFATALLLVWKRFVGWERTALGALLLAYAAHNFFVFDHLGSYLIFFSLLAFLHHRSTTTDTASVNSKKLSENSASVVPPWWYTASSTLAIVLIGTIWISIVRPVRAGTALIDAMTPRAPATLSEVRPFFERAITPRTLGQQEARLQLALAVASLPQQALSVSVPLDAVKEMFAFAVREADAEIRRVPRDARLRYLAGALLLPYGLYEDARRQFTAALELSPRKLSLMHAVGLTFVGEKKFRESFLYFEQALALAPRRYETLVEYAAASVRAGDLAHADALLLRVGGGNRIARDDRLTNAYFESGQVPALLLRWEEAVQQETTNAEGAFFAGRIALAIDEKTRAARLFRSAIARDSAYRSTVEDFLKSVNIVLPL